MIYFRRFFNDVSSFDALWFHEWDLHRKTAQEYMPSSRSPEQLYFLFNMEPPTKIMQVTYEHRRSEDIFLQYHNFMDNYFNFTMTYQRAADFYNPYGHIELQNETISQLSGSELETLIDDFASKNTHLAEKSSSQSGAVVTQFVSNCKSTSGR